jgi:thiosulfate reductase cytochrome b subunit
MAPTQLLLIIPFVGLGEWLMHAPRQAVSIKAGLALMAQGIWHSVVVLKDAILHASIAWALMAPFLIYLFYRLLTPLFERAAAELRRSQT